MIRPSTGRIGSSAIGKTTSAASAGQGRRWSFCFKNSTTFKFKSGALDEELGWQELLLTKKGRPPRESKMRLRLAQFHFVKDGDGLKCCKPGSTGKPWCGSCPIKPTRGCGGSSRDGSLSRHAQHHAGQGCRLWPSREHGLCRRRPGCGLNLNIDKMGITFDLDPQ